MERVRCLRARVVAGVALLSLLAPPSAESQVVTGRITAEPDGAALGSVSVTLEHPSTRSVRRTITDADGRYEMRAPEPGDYRVVADHLGYRRLESPLMTVGEARTVTIDFELPVDPVEVEGLEVAVQRRAELRRRVAQYGVRPELLGTRFVPREEIEKRPTALNIGQVLQWQNMAGVSVSWSNSPPSLCVLIRRGQCALVVLDGAIVHPEVAASIPPESIEAVVVLTPVESTLSYGTAGGLGAVLLFTRAGVAGGAR